MNESPFRNMLFLGALLFIILSSGSLQCALNCYERVSQCSSDAEQVTDCHPVTHIQLAQSPASYFCHPGHSSTQAENDPSLQRIDVRQFLALFSPQSESPVYRSADPVTYSFPQTSSNIIAVNDDLPLSQNLKQLRSTILLI